MNRAHAIVCSSGRWARIVERELLPWALKGVELGEDVLEVGPGYGATTRVLAGRTSGLTALELEPRYCERLRGTLPDSVTVQQGDATQMPFPDGRFSAVVCFTMLHHVPSAPLQDRVFAEVARVLRDGGTFAGSYSIGTGHVFKLLHVRDTLVPIAPDALPQRLAQAGLSGAKVDIGGRSFRFRARKGGEASGATPGAR